MTQPESYSAQGCVSLHSTHSSSKWEEADRGACIKFQSSSGHHTFPKAPHVLRSLPAFQTWFAKFLGHSFQAPFFPRPRGQSKAAELE